MEASTEKERIIRQTYEAVGSLLICPLIHSLIRDRAIAEEIFNEIISKSQEKGFFNALVEETATQCAAYPEFILVGHKLQALYIGVLADHIKIVFDHPAIKQILANKSYLPPVAPETPSSLIESTATHPQDHYVPPRPISPLPEDSNRQDLH